MASWSRGVGGVAIVLALPLACAARNQEGASTATPRYPVATAKAPASATPPVIASAGPPASAAPPDAGLEKFVAWTDPAGVRALLRGEALPDDVDDPRACNFHVPEQSCIPDEFAVEWDCKLGCANDCGSCAKDCRATLASCRAPCEGDGACETTCGRAAGLCVQSCLSSRDRCYTGECARRVSRYLEDWRTKFGCKASGALVEICVRTNACVETCLKHGFPGEPGAEACIAACKKKHAPGCNERFLDMATAGACQVFNPSL